MTPPAAATAARSAPAVRPRRPAVARPPRRVSGPLRPATSPRQAGARAGAGQAGLAVDLLSALESLAQHRLLDRLIRGRVWIGLVAFALIGIVTLQLGLLKLNGGIGRALEHEALLQRENAALSIENSELSAATRVQRSAAQLGMTSVPVRALRFLPAGGSPEASKAAAALAGAAHAAAQAREASAAEAEALSTSEAESSGESAGTGTSETESEASGSTSSSEEATTSGEASAASEPSSSESPAAQSTESSAAGSEAESSGGSAASSTGE
jgi:cell division protein FtsL